jgi:ATP-dependent helicase/DNAse subunit B
VDRVDELADGGKMVIDYKSGSNNLQDWLGERPCQPQLPLYGMTTGVQGLAFAEVRPRESRFRGLAISDSVPGVSADIGKAVGRYTGAEDFDTLLQDWRRDLTALAESFMAGEGRVDPLGTACTYCGLQPLCRVDLEPQEVDG